MATALNCDRATMHFNQALDQRQSDPETGRHAFGTAIELGEHFEDEITLVCGDAYPAVGNRYYYIAGLPFGRYLDRSLGRREFGSVVEQIRKHLRQPIGVGVQQDR